MAGMEGMVRKAFMRYARERYPDEAADIIGRAEALFPELKAKAPDIGGKENLMAYNLDTLILAVAYYEASAHRIDGPAIEDMARELFKKYAFVGRLIDVNRPWQMKLLQKIMYGRYIPYAKLVEEKKAQGLWGNTWSIRINPRNTSEGASFDLVGCPLADYARANGYTELLPHLCACDHLTAQVVHAKLIRTHTCARGSDSCDYWYVADGSETARNFDDDLIV